MKTRKPERIRQWINEFGPCRTGAAWDTAGEARAAARELALAIEALAPRTRVAVPLIEIRRGEVVVDVEALVREFEMLDRNPNSYTVSNLRAALKKVGVR